MDLVDIGSDRLQIWRSRPSDPEIETSDSQIWSSDPEIETISRGGYAVLSKQEHADGIRIHHLRWLEPPHQHIGGASDSDQEHSVCGVQMRRSETMDLDDIGSDRLQILRS